MFILSICTGYYVLYRITLNEKLAIIQDINSITKINLTSSNIEILYSKNTHSGFHGDGEKLEIINIKNNANVEKKLEEWNDLPVTEDLNILLYGGTRNNIQYENYSELKKNIPKLQSGKYIVIDKQAEKEIENFNLDNKPKNYAIIMYDKTNRKIYFYSSDI